MPSKCLKQEHKYVTSVRSTALMSEENAAVGFLSHDKIQRKAVQIPAVVGLKKNGAMTAIPSAPICAAC